MAKYFYNFSDRPPGAFANGQGMTNITTGPGTKIRSVVEYSSPAPGGKVFRIIQGATNGQDLTAFDVMNNHGDDTESLTLFSVNAAVQVPGSYGVVTWDYTSANQGLTLGFLPESNVKSVILYDDKAGTTVQFANYNWTNGQRYWLRHRVEGGNQHFVRIWPDDGTPEPSTWLFTATYANRTTGARYMGLGTYTANHTIDYFQASFATGGDTAPSTIEEYKQWQREQIDAANNSLPPSTPIVGFSGGYGGPFAGYGSALGLALENTELVIASAAHNHTAGGVVVTQVHKTAIANASHGHAADSPTIKQAHRLTIASALHTHLATSVSVTENYNLSVNNVAHSLSSDNLVLVTGFAAVPQDSLNSLTSDNVNLVQAQTLVVSNTTHGHTSTTLDIVEAKILLIDDTAHSVIDSIGDLSQVHNLAAANTTHSHTADGNLAILQNQLLAIANAVHATSSDQVSIIHFTLLGKPDDGVFDVGDTSTDLVQQHTLEAQSTSHFFKSDTIIKIINWSELGFDYGYYITNNPRGGSLEAADGIQHGFIAPNAVSRGTFELVDVNEGRYKPDNIETGNF